MKPISISLSPNTQKDDVFLALKLLFQPWKLRTPSTNYESHTNIRILEKEFKNYHNVQYAYSFNSGRSALMAILYALNIGEDPSFAPPSPQATEGRSQATAGKDEVIIQAFTCNAVPNPIIWSGARPIYADIDEALNMDPVDLERKITLRQASAYANATADKSAYANATADKQGKPPKAVIVQHTFGIPANMDRILEIAGRHKLIVVEDCAHALGARYRGKLVGTLGDVSFFSFGRDKVISSVYGGMAITNNPQIAKRLEEFWRKCSYPPYFWVFQQLLHPIIFAAAVPFYNFLNIGKIMIRAAQKAKLLSLAVTRKEKHGGRPYYFPKRMPQALAELALKQFKKLDGFNAHRRELVSFYMNNLQATGLRNFYRNLSSEDSPIFLRFPAFSPRRDEILKAAKKQGIYLGDWYASVIAPSDTDFEKMRYVGGSCPKAEEAANEIFNLPTHINIEPRDAEKIVQFLNKF